MQKQTDGPNKDEQGADILRENARLRGDLMTVARRLSHDLRTPLGGVISAGEALKEILGETDPGSLPLVAAALNSADEISQLIKRTSFVLKATARPEQPKLMPMEDAVGAALQRLESRILAKGATLALPAAWPQINGVQSWLETVWWNLLANALLHANQRPLRIELGWGKESEQFRFWVSDNGSGVAEGRQESLFQPFDRLHEPDAARGLGLSIVQRLIDLQGGSCGYQATPQGGACFFFRLP